MKAYRTLLFSALGLSLLTACSSGRQQRIRVEVGEVREVKLSGRGDASLQLIGTSENNEVVEVSKRLVSPAVDTLQPRNAGPSVFEIKGVTNGTARVVFSEKPAGEAGPGKVRKRYLVQVVSK
ncbi:hypothetical protein [Larkinella soli]|uniref:hypothetical protein n=1 Tax=Larkinella soli TaxID=1770527 RepID=UPI000FFB2E7F|nr:hypothetical protein [Larkinella soli]